MFGYLSLILVALLAFNAEAAENDEDPLRPNIIVLMVDDLGFGDLASYGNPSQEHTPVDTLMAEGTRFTNAYSADSLCSPSRAGFLTGRLPVRLGVYGSKHRVFTPKMTGGLPKHEQIIPELLRDAGYYTGMIGKWNLGINSQTDSDGTHLPKNRGFDFVGLNLPLTNLWECDLNNKPPNNTDPIRTCFLYNESTVVQQPIKFDHLTEQLVYEWRRFFHGRAANGVENKPFFFYFSFPHVHTALFANSHFKDKSIRGLFGDNVNEMGWAVGQLMEDIKKSNVADNTLVIFMSDHGPHVEMCNHGGSTAGLKGGKSNSFEGAVHKNAKETEKSSYCLDLNGLPSELCKDGVDIWCELRGHTSTDPDCKSESTLPQKKLEDRRPIFYYCNKNLLAIRLGNYKVHYKTTPIFFNLTLGVCLESYCPEGIPQEDWYTDLNCPEDSLINLTHPELYHIGNDPFELHPLHNCSKNVEVIEKIGQIRDLHLLHTIPAPSQLEECTDAVLPCCHQEGQPKCQCDKIEIDLNPEPLTSSATYYNFKQPHMYPANYPTSSVLQRILEEDENKQKQLIPDIL
uniref:Sulfatase N-terminal domain-containing protein n=1 Tax=Ditylenchus dipsaci TaxID=166011 RepID=A0A915DZ75_9BILA